MTFPEYHLANELVVSLAILLFSVLSLYWREEIQQNQKIGVFRLLAMCYRILQILFKHHTTRWGDRRIECPQIYRLERAGAKKEFQPQNLPNDRIDRNPICVPLPRRRRALVISVADRITGLSVSRIIIQSTLHLSYDIRTQNRTACMACWKFYYPVRMRRDMV